MAEGICTREKKRWKHLELEFIHQEQTPKEGITHLDEIRIRFIVCLSFIKLNWWQAMDFAYYLFFLKRIKGNMAQNLRKSSWTTGRIGKNEWIDMITNDENSCMNHRKNKKNYQGKDSEHQEELAHERRYLIREYLVDAPVRFGEQ